MSTRAPGLRRPYPSPALRAWRRELADRQRTPVTFDALWRAASREQLAMEAEADGLAELARSYRREAARILGDAAQEQRMSP